MSRWKPDNPPPGGYSLHGKTKEGNGGQRLRDAIPARTDGSIPDVHVRVNAKGEGSQVIVPRYIPAHLKGAALKRFLKKHPRGQRIKWQALPAESAVKPVKVRPINPLPQSEENKEAV